MKSTSFNTLALALVGTLVLSACSGKSGSGGGGEQPHHTPNIIQQPNITGAFDNSRGANRSDVIGNPSEHIAIRNQTFTLVDEGSSRIRYLNKVIFTFDSNGNLNATAHIDVAAFGATGSQGVDPWNRQHRPQVSGVEIFTATNIPYQYKEINTSAGVTGRLTLGQFIAASNRIVPLNGQLSVGQGYTNPYLNPVQPSHGPQFGFHGQAHAQIGAGPQPLPGQIPQQTISSGRLGVLISPADLRARNRMIVYHRDSTANLIDVYTGNTIELADGAVFNPRSAGFALKSRIAITSGTLIPLPYQRSEYINGHTQITTFQTEELSLNMMQNSIVYTAPLLAPQGN